MKIISLLNMKCGVAKTFMMTNMAYKLWRRGYKGTTTSERILVRYTRGVMRRV